MDRQRTQSVGLGSPEAFRVSTWEGEASSSPRLADYHSTTGAAHFQMVIYHVKILAYRVMPLDCVRKLIVEISKMYPCYCRYHQGPRAAYAVVQVRKLGPESSLIGLHCR